MNLRDIFKLLKATYRQYRDDNGTRLAASLAFYSAISIVPLLTTMLGLLGAAIGRDTANAQLLTQAEQLLGPQAAEFINQIITGGGVVLPEPSNLTRILKVLLVLWGSTNVFFELQDSLNAIWNIEPKPGQPIARMLNKRLISFGLIIALGFLILVSLVLSAVVSFLLAQVRWLSPQAEWVWQLVNLLFTLFGSTLLFALLYKHVPDIKVTWRVMWLGASVTGVLFTLGTVALKALLGGQGAPFGVTGSLIVFLLWVYYSAQIVFFGAELTQVYAEQAGSLVEPTPGMEFAPPRRGRA